MSELVPEPRQKPVVPMKPMGINANLLGYIGIDSIIEQMRKKTMKTGFDFNIMVVGRQGPAEVLGPMARGCPMRPGGRASPAGRAQGSRQRLFWGEGEPAQGKQTPTAPSPASLALFPGPAVITGPLQVSRASSLQSSGQSGLGKSTLVNTLFKSQVSRKSSGWNREEKIPKTVEIKAIGHGKSEVSGVEAIPMLQHSLAEDPSSLCK